MSVLHMTQETEQIDPTWPPEVALILTALAAGRWADERRSTPRRTYRVKAGLRLYTDDPGSERRCLFTSNVSRRGLGFLTQHRLPLGYGGTVEIPAPDNRTLKVECTLLRCRQAAPGWYEGALHFIRDQEDFDAAVSSEQKFDLY